MPRAAPRPHHLARLAAALLAAAVVLAGLDVPLLEDGRFWWVPKGLWIVEHGPAWSPAGELPDALAGPLIGRDPVPQWSGGLPDWDHPPLWYLWLGLFLSVSPTVQAVHLASLLPAVLAAVGWVAVAERLGRAWAGLAVLCLPPVVAQLLRPDLDLPLLAVVPWALCALLDRRWVAFALLGLLAPWLKEPSVILAGPALLAALPTLPRDRTGRPARVAAALAPLLGLGLWRLVHGHLANPETLARSPGEYVENLIVMSELVLLHQGRWVLLLGLPLLALRLRPGRADVPPDARSLAEGAALLGVFALTWILFFAAVGFFATQGREEPHTHVRYLLPGLCAGAVLLSAGLPRRLAPALALPGLAFLTARSPYGPEASLWGVQVALAERDAAPWLQDRLDAGAEVWVGSYAAAGLAMPWTGVVDAPLGGDRAREAGLRHFAEATDWRAPPPAGPVEGALVLLRDHGEPDGALRRARVLTPVESWTRGEVGVSVWRVGEVIPREPGETGTGTREPR